jgi:preprotein translocase subunit SecF
MNWWHGPNSFIKKAYRIILTNVASHLTDGVIFTLVTTLASLIFPATAAVTIGLLAGFVSSLAVSHYFGQWLDPEYKS